jgi:hypothetical protein
LLEELVSRNIWVASLSRSDAIPRVGHLFSGKTWTVENVPTTNFSLFPRPSRSYPSHNFSLRRLTQRVFFFCGASLLFLTFLYPTANQILLNGRNRQLRKDSETCASIKEIMLIELFIFLLQFPPQR